MSPPHGGIAVGFCFAQALRHRIRRVPLPVIARFAEGVQLCDALASSVARLLLPSGCRADYLQVSRNIAGHRAAQRRKGNQKGSLL